MKTKEEIRDFIIQKEKDGMVVFNTFEGLMSSPLDEIIKQPTEGLLYDLNRDKATIMHWIDDEKWINDYAVALVITALKDKIDKLEAKP